MIDDVPAICVMLRDLLREEGYRATTALRGQEAAHLLAQERFDLVISDVVMPGLDGLCLLCWAPEHHPDTRVILMSGYWKPDAAEEAHRWGAAALLIKPLHIDDVLQTVQQVLGAAEAAAAKTGDRSPSG